MKLIIGLGNPGAKYQNTRHNFGFMAVDALAHRFSAVFRESAYNGLIAEAKNDIAGKVYLLKPATYMNRSGLSAGPFTAFYKIPPEDIIAVHDDLALPLGRMRFTPKGSAGGHNGIKSLIEALGTQHFNRLKLGIGRPADDASSPSGDSAASKSPTGDNRVDTVDFVLQKFLRDEAALAGKIIALAVEAVEFWIENDTAMAMNRYNGAGL